MTDDELRALGGAILVGEEAPAGASPAELRRSVELAVDDLSRRLAPFGYVVRAIDAKSQAEIDAEASRRSERIVLTVIVLFAVITFAFVVLYFIAKAAGLAA